MGEREGERERGREGERERGREREGERGREGERERGREGERERGRGKCTSFCERLFELQFMQQHRILVPGCLIHFALNPGMTVSAREIGSSQQRDSER